MSAYVIVDVDVHDPAGYEAYRSQTAPTVVAYGGRFLARGGATAVLEGDWTPKRLIIIEFESIERARAWLNSPEYSAIKTIRHRTAHTNMIVVEGV